MGAAAVAEEPDGVIDDGEDIAEGDTYVDAVVVVTAVVVGAATVAPAVGRGDKSSCFQLTMRSKILLSSESFCISSLALMRTVTHATS